MRPVRHRLMSLVLAIALLLLLTPSAEAGCIKRHKVRIAKGASPSGSDWTVDGTIGNNGGNCHEWLFGMDFALEGVGSWGSATGIPAGGHIGRGFEIWAADDLLEDGTSRVFSGAVNGEVARIVVTLSNNKHLTIRPKSPPPRLRRKVDWLRNVRYFVQFYPPVGFVTGVATLNASGVLLYRDKSFEDF